MKILAKGSENRLTELKAKLSGVSCDLTCIDDNHFLFDANVHDYDLIFDLKFDEKYEQLKYYARLKGVPVFVCAVKQSLAQTVHHYKDKVECHLFGINALPGFINRGLAEVSVWKNEDAPMLDNCMKELSWNYRLVADRVGMVTPRVVFMIINEACYTLQEGTASMRDIDISMKLGTNYPLGPFEWADQVGLRHVYETLEALWTDTHEERYKICPLLKTKYLRAERFYHE